MSKFRTHYDNLKVARNAPDSIIRAAYKTLMQQYHPDKFEGSVDEALRIAKLIKQSYDVLIDPAKRAEHDRWIKEKEAKSENKSNNDRPNTENQSADQPSHEKRNEREKPEYKPNNASSLRQLKLYPTKKGIFWALFFIASAFSYMLFTSIYQTYSDKAIIYLVHLSTGALGILLLNTLIKVFDEKPVILADDNGLIINKFAGAELSWGEISEINYLNQNYMGSYDNVFLILIKLNNYDKFLKSQSIWRRFEFFISSFSDLPPGIVITSLLIEEPLYKISEDLIYLHSIYKNNLNKNYKDDQKHNYRVNNAWSRFFARIFDFSLELLIVQFTLGFILGYSWNGFIEWILIKENQYIFYFLSIPLAFCFDALIFHLFGNTPGKAMLGLFVQGVDEQALDTEKYLKRNLGVWKSGLSFGIPFLNIYTMVKQFNLVKKGLQTTYDEPAGYVVLRKEMGWIWKLFFSFSFIFILMIWSTLSNLEKSITNKEIASKNNKITWDSLTPSSEKRSIEEILSKYENPIEKSNLPKKTSTQNESSVNQYDEDYYKAATELAKVYPELAEDGPASDKVLTLSGYYVNQGLKPADALRRAVRDLYQTNKQ